MVDGNGTYHVIIVVFMGSMRQDQKVWPIISSSFLALNTGVIWCCWARKFYDGQNVWLNHTACSGSLATIMASLHTHDWWTLSAIDWSDQSVIHHWYESTTNQPVDQPLKMIEYVLTYYSPSTIIINATIAHSLPATNQYSSVRQALTIVTMQLFAEPIDRPWFATAWMCIPT